jgi:hypothetical protein
MNADVIPDGAYPMTVVCSRCGGKFQTWTDANMSDPEVAALVRRFMAITTCDRCKRLSGTLTMTPPWEQPRQLPNDL